MHLAVPACVGAALLVLGSRFNSAALCVRFNILPVIPDRTPDSRICDSSLFLPLLPQPKNRHSQHCRRLVFIKKLLFCFCFFFHFVTLHMIFFCFHAYRVVLTPTDTTRDSRKNHLGIKKGLKRLKIKCSRPLSYFR